MEKLLKMCQERAGVLHSVQETARTISHSSEKRGNEQETFCEIPKEFHVRRV